jgi:AcrR family transcriptional regulator
MRSDKTGVRRLRSPQRREQIVEATLDLVAEYGVPGTTLTRIASAVGVTTPALYAHFPNRKEILLAALDVLIQRRSAAHRLATKGTALDRLREIGHRHSILVCSDDKSVLALFEFIAAPPEEGLRETLGERHLGLVDEIAKVVKQGQDEGTIIKEADPHQVAWMIVSRAWTEDIAQIMGISHGWSLERSNQMLEYILASIAVPNQERTIEQPPS